MIPLISPTQYLQNEPLKNLTNWLDINYPIVSKALQNSEDLSFTTLAVLNDYPMDIVKEGVYYADRTIRRIYFKESQMPLLYGQCIIRSLVSQCSKLEKVYQKITESPSMWYVKHLPSLIENLMDTENKVTGLKPVLELKMYKS